MFLFFGSKSKENKETNVTENTKDSFKKEIIKEDEIVKDEIVKDEIVKDEIVKDEIVKDEIVKDEIVNDEIVNDEIVKEDKVTNSQLDELKSEVSKLTSQLQELKQIQQTQRSNEVILYFDGTLYVGSVRSDQYGYFIPHGYGTICYPFGARYIGELRDGEYHGRGTFYQDYYTSPFTTDWIHNVPHGNITWDGVHFFSIKNGVIEL